MNTCTLPAVWNSPCESPIAIGYAAAELAAMFERADREMRASYPDNFDPEKIKAAEAFIESLMSDESDA